MTEKTKLYHNTSAGFALPLYVGPTRTVATEPADDIPMLEWPDGRWCFEANIYMLSLYRRGLSRRNRGGTLHTYATNISHLLRYCFANNIELIDLTDNQFTFFIKSLQGERRDRDPNCYARDANSVIAIGRNCLDFLTCVSRLHNDDDLIGQNGRIRTEEKSFEIPFRGALRGKGKIRRRYWHHRAFPTPDPQIKRFPVGADAIQRLREAVLPMGGSLYMRKRRYVMLMLLEITGGRRSEVVNLTVESVREAAGMEYPMLKLITVKRKGRREDHRLIPIARHDVLLLLEFIDKNRRYVVRTTCGLDHDDGYVFISDLTGRKVTYNFFTQEMAKLKKQAGIREKACPHMFRHRFITKLFVSLIQEHELKNQDEFRRALIDTEAMKQKLQQWTGHKDVNSLNVYINLAFDEITNFKQTFDILGMKRSLASFKAGVAQIRHELVDGGSPSLASDQLCKIIAAFEIDVAGIQA